MVGEEDVVGAVVKVVVGVVKVVVVEEIVGSRKNYIGNIFQYGMI